MLLFALFITNMRMIYVYDKNMLVPFRPGVLGITDVIDITCIFIINVLWLNSILVGLEEPYCLLGRPM